MCLLFCQCYQMLQSKVYWQAVSYFQTNEQENFSFSFKLELDLIEYTRRKEDKNYIKQSGSSLK